MNTAPRTKDGKFRRLRQAERIQRLAAKGVEPKAIAKQTGVRYQTIWRTLNRKNRKAVAVVATKPEGDLECDNPYCLHAVAEICECQCGGVNHGALTVN